MSAKPFGFAKAERIRVRKEFLLASREARKRLETPSFIVLLRPNQRPYARLGITVTKKIGPAAQRNRIKRQLREFYRINKCHLPPGHDILIIARQGAAGLKHQQVWSELNLMIDRPLN